ncbi:hypothetical protein AAHE18_19G089200 [Arachis hypogaea]
MMRTTATNPSFRLCLVTLKAEISKIISQANSKQFMTKKQMREKCSKISYKQLNNQIFEAKTREKAKQECRKRERKKELKCTREMKTTKIAWCCDEGEIT